MFISTCRFKATSSRPSPQPISYQPRSPAVRYPERRHNPGDARSEPIERSAILPQPRFLCRRPHQHHHLLPALWRVQLQRSPNSAYKATQEWFADQRLLHLQPHLRRFDSRLQLHGPQPAPRSGYNRPNRLPVTGIYDVPFFKNSNFFLKNLVGNLEFAPVYTFQSPQFTTVQGALDSNLNNDSAGDRTSSTPTVLREPAAQVCR